MVAYDSRKRPALVATTFLNSRGGCLLERRLYKESNVYCSLHSPETSAPLYEMNFFCNLERNAFARQVADIIGRVKLLLRNKLATKDCVASLQEKWAILTALFATLRDTEL